MPWIVEFPVIPASLGSWYLRGLGQTGDADRAAQFPTEGAARIALLNARPYIKPAAYRRAIVREYRA